jgi:pimeloyl-ACP methyl ester carboxylesterase
VKRLLLIMIAATACGAAQHPAATPAPTMFSVSVTGHGRPIVLVPGLAAPPEVWDATAKHLAEKWQVHVLWLAGFAGKPAPASAEHYLDRVDAELTAYVKSLDHPILVGHSMGGVIVYRLAEEAPDAIAGAVVVDAAPFIGAAMQPNATAASVEPDARQFRDAMAGGGDEWKHFPDMLAKMVTDPAGARLVTDAAQKSDPKIVGEAFYEMFLLDERAELKDITVPLLVILADSGDDAAAIEAQLAGAPNHRSVTVPHTKHFVMLDDPSGFQKALDDWLLGIGKVR